MVIELCAGCAEVEAEKYVTIDDIDVLMCKSCLKRLYVGSSHWFERQYNKMPNVKDK